MLFFSNHYTGTVYLLSKLVQDESVEGHEPKYPTGPKGSESRPEGERDLIVSSFNYYCLSGCCAFSQQLCASLGYGDGGGGLTGSFKSIKGITFKTTDVLVKYTPVANKNVNTNECCETSVQCVASTTCKKCCNGSRFVVSYFPHFCW